MAAEGQTDKMASDMDMYMHVYVAKVLKWIPLCGKIAYTDIHRCLINVYGHQTVYVSTVRW